MPNIPVTKTYKRPLENERTTFSFLKSLGTSETVSTVTSVVAKPAEGLTITGIVLSTPQVQCLVSGGLHGEKYVLTCTVATSGGQSLQNDIEIEIETARTS